ncbi:MAG: sugar ABC transporter permease [Eubacteriales bacterium]|nr:sugar ABC transporter permease [Eubacteriales bacterium]
MKNNKFVAAVLLPSFLFLFIFVIFPVIYGLGISLYDYNPANSKNVFLGAENYVRLLQDATFWKAVKNTFFFCVVAVVLNIAITLFLAELISHIRSGKIRVLFRAVLFIPCIAPMIGTSMIWKYGIVGTDGGLLNQILIFLGKGPKNWYLTEMPLMWIIIIYTLWADIGYNVILFTAGLSNIPKAFEEAAAIDGAGPLRRFFLVKLPLLGRTFAFVSIMTMANYFQMFAQFRVLAPKGGMHDSAMVLTNYIYRTSFQSFDMGYGAAIATGLFIIVFIVAMIQNQLMRVEWSYE